MRDKFLIFETCVRHLSTRDTNKERGSAARPALAIVDVRKSKQSDQRERTCTIEDKIVFGEIRVGIRG